MELRLNEDEAGLLLLLLDRARGELKYQISDTDDSRFKAQLRQEKELIEAMSSRMREVGVEPMSVAFPPPKPEVASP